MSLGLAYALFMRRKPSSDLFFSSVIPMALLLLEQELGAGGDRSTIGGKLPDVSVAQKVDPGAKRGPLTVDTANLSSSMTA